MSPKHQRLAADVFVFVVSTALFYTALSLILSPRDVVASGQVTFFYGLF